MERSNSVRDYIETDMRKNGYTWKNCNDWPRTAMTRGYLLVVVMMMMMMKMTT